MENLFIKIMTKSNHRKTKLSPIYARLSVLQLDKMYQLQMIKFMFKFKVNVLPECLTNYYSLLKILAFTAIRLDLSKMIYIMRFE